MSRIEIRDLAPVFVPGWYDASVRLSYYRQKGEGGHLFQP